MLLRDLECLRPQPLGHRTVVTEVERLEQLATDEPVREVVEHRFDRSLLTVDAGPPIECSRQRDVLETEVVGDRDVAAARHRRTDLETRRFVTLARELGEPLERLDEQPLGRAHGLVVIDLRVHVRTREQILLDRVHAAAIVDDEIERIISASNTRDLDRVNDPVEIVGRVARAGVVTVAQQVVETIDIELRADQLAREVRLVVFAPERLQRLRKIRLERLERLDELRILGRDPRAPAFVIVTREHVLPRVRERTVADVVEQRRDLDVTRDLRVELEPARDSLRDMKRPERVAEPRVLRTGIYEPREPHLLDAPQALHRERFDQLGDRSILTLELDEPVDGVAENAVLHAVILAPLLRRSGLLGTQI